MPDRDFDIGQMRHRVTVVVPGQKPNRSDPNIGRADAADDIRGTFWAKVEPLTGYERVNAQRIKATISHKITMRVNGKLPPTARLIFPGVESPYPAVIDMADRRAFQVVNVLREGEVNGWYQALTESTP